MFRSIGLKYVKSRERRIIWIIYVKFGDMIFVTLAWIPKKVLKQQLDRKIDVCLVKIVCIAFIYS